MVVIQKHITVEVDEIEVVNKASDQALCNLWAYMQTDSVQARIYPNSEAAEREIEKQARYEIETSLNL